jgi:uncharacterized protein (DUF58 family)
VQESSLTDFHPLEDEAERFAAALPPLMIEAERLASVVSLGVHGRRKAGMGESFWQFRRYRAEDPSAAIDWRQSAKSPHLFVREREWEAAQGVWFWRDGSRGMQFGSERVSKLERANLLAVALASLLVRGGERIAIFGDRRGPQGSRSALRRLARALTDEGSTSALPPEAPIAKNGQLVWLSDFLFPLAEFERSLAQFTRIGAQVHLIHIIDPAEEEFPYSGRTRFEAADGILSETLGRAENVADSYRARFRAHAESIAASARKLNWGYLAHRTDRSPHTALIGLCAEMSGATRR